MRLLHHRTRAPTTPPSMALQVLAYPSWHAACRAQQLSGPSLVPQLGFEEHLPFKVSLRTRVDPTVDLYDAEHQ